MNGTTSDTAGYAAKELLNIETDRQVCTVRFSPDGRQLLGGGYDAVIRRWDFTAEEPTQLDPLTGHHGWVQALEFVEETSTFLSADSWGNLLAWELNESAAAPKWTNKSAHDGWIHDLSVSHDGTVAATVGLDRVLRLWSTVDGNLLQEFPPHSNHVYRVAVHPDNNHVVTADLLGTVRSFSCETGQCEHELTFEKMHFYDRIQDVPGIYVLQFDKDGELTVAGGQPARIQNHQGIPTIHRIDHATFECVSTQSFGVATDGFIFDLAWHSAGFQVAVTSGNPGAGQLLLIGPDEKDPFFKHTKMSNCHSLAMHPDGKRFVVAATNRRSQGNGAVRDKDGIYLGNSSPLHLFELAAVRASGDE